MKNRLIFGTQSPEETRHWKIMNLPTSPINCWRTTLRSVESDFLTIFDSNFV